MGLWSKLTGKDTHHPIQTLRATDGVKKTDDDNGMFKTEIVTAMSSPVGIALDATSDLLSLLQERLKTARRAYSSESQTVTTLAEVISELSSQQKTFLSIQNDINTLTRGMSRNETVSENALRRAAGRIYHCSDPELIGCMRERLESITSDRKAFGPLLDTLKETHTTISERVYDQGNHIVEFFESNAQLLAKNPEPVSFKSTVSTKLGGMKASIGSAINRLDDYCASTRVGQWINRTMENHHGPDKARAYAR